MVVGIHQVDVFVHLHVFFHHFEFLAKNVDNGGIESVHIVVDTIARHVTLGAAREAPNHGEVVLLHAIEADGQVVLGGQRHIVLAVGGRLTVLASINAEDAEVASVTGPHPVVGVATELTNRRVGHTNETHIWEHLIDKHVVLVAFKETLDDRVVLAIFRSSSFQLLDFLTDGSLLILIVHIVGHHTEDFLGDIFHADEEAGGHFGGGQFLAIVFGPEAVAEIVMLVGAEFLDGAIATVVVGEEQTVFAHDFTCAEEASRLGFAAETHDGVFQTAVVDTVKLFRGQLKTHLLHVNIIQALDEHREPHAFIGIHAANRNEDGHCNDS